LSFQRILKPQKIIILCSQWLCSESIIKADLSLVLIDFVCRVVFSRRFASNYSYNQLLQRRADFSLNILSKLTRSLTMLQPGCFQLACLSKGESRSLIGLIYRLIICFKTKRLWFGFQGVSLLFRLSSIFFAGSFGHFPKTSTNVYKFTVKSVSVDKNVSWRAAL